jgi:hypothetical protein
MRWSAIGLLITVGLLVIVFVPIAIEILGKKDDAVTLAEKIVALASFGKKTPKEWVRESFILSHIRIF